MALRRQRDGHLPKLDQDWSGLIYVCLSDGGIDVISRSRSRMSSLPATLNGTSSFLDTLHNSSDLECVVYL